MIITKYTILDALLTVNEIKINAYYRDKIQLSTKLCYCMLHVKCAIETKFYITLMWSLKPVNECPSFVYGKAGTTVWWIHSATYIANNYNDFIVEGQEASITQEEEYQTLSCKGLPSTVELQWLEHL